MKVLIAVDDSACSAAAVDYVLEQCWPKDAEFRVLSVVEPVSLQYPIDLGYAGAIVAAESELTNQTEKLIRDKMNHLKRGFGDGNVTGSVITGPAALSILDVAKEWNADLIVMGSHGRRGLQKLFLGSVAEKVARCANCSVEIVKSKVVNEKPSEKSIA